MFPGCSRLDEEGLLVLYPFKYFTATEAGSAKTTNADTIVQSPRGEAVA